MRKLATIIICALLVINILIGDETVEHIEPYNSGTVTVHVFDSAATPGGAVYVVSSSGWIRSMI